MSCMERKTNEEVLGIADERKTLLNYLEARRGMIGQLIRRVNFLKTIIEAKI